MTVDKTVLTTDATQNFAANFSSAFGADGAGTLTYALGVVAGGSGLTDTATGEAVNLSLNGAVVEGRTATTNLLVFTVSVADSALHLSRALFDLCLLSIDRDNSQSAYLLMNIPRYDGTQKQKSRSAT
ncbi:DUF5801 domain-containing protein [Pseudomonas sp. B21-015]|nr:DUF5801 domain-containing protein [Pseudomonas sp. B21-015]